MLDEPSRPSKNKGEERHPKLREAALHPLAPSQLAGKMERWKMIPSISTP